MPAGRAWLPACSGGEGFRLIITYVRHRRQKLLLVESCRKRICDRNKPVLVCWVKRAPVALGEFALVYKRLSLLSSVLVNFGAFFIFVLPFLPPTPAWKSHGYNCSSVWVPACWRDSWLYKDDQGKV